MDVQPQAEPTEPVSFADILDDVGTRTSLDLPLTATSLLRASRLLFARVRFLPYLQFDETELDALVTREGAVFDEVTTVWCKSPRIDRSTVAVLPLAGLIEQPCGEEDVHAIARILARVWPMQLSAARWHGTGGEPPRLELALTERIHLCAVDPGNAPHLACAVYSAVAMAIGAPELDDAARETFHISTGHDDDHVSCRFVRHEYTYSADGGPKLQWLLHRYAIRRADLAQFELELRALTSGDGIAWLQSAHQFDPVLDRDGPHVNTRMLDDHKLDETAVGFTLFIRRCQDDPSTLEISWNFHTTSGSHSYVTYDIDTLITALGSQVADVTTTFPARGGAAASPRPRRSQPGTWHETTFTQNDRVFPSFEGSLGDDLFE